METNEYCAWRYDEVDRRLSVEYKSLVPFSELRDSQLVIEN